jgi:hypothetical protein
MPKSFVIATALLACLGGSASAENFNPAPLHAKFIDAFNNRQWEALRPLLAKDIVFHRADATEVYDGSDKVIDHFRQTIGGEWNVKLVRLDFTDQVTGKDGWVVERGDFAITAGADNENCLFGSYMMTWAPQTPEMWQLEWLSWQDIDTDLENCK